MVRDTEYQKDIKVLDIQNQEVYFHFLFLLWSVSLEVLIF